MFSPLDSLLHSETRLAIISILMGVEEAEFTALKQMTQVSAGNLSLQLDKLHRHEYVQLEKTFKNKYPVTKCRITPKGKAAFELYVKTLKQYIEIENRTPEITRPVKKSKAA
ncbi:MAG: transcriptional regulator [Chitinophagales bacterium]